MNLSCLKRLLILCFTLNIFGLNAQAETLRVGLSELDYPPFYFIKHDKLAGAAIEIAEAVSTLAGYELAYNRVPWKRLQGMLKTGSLDMVILYFKTRERAKDVYYTDEPHLYENSYVVVPKGLKTTFDGNIHSLINYEMFYVNGYSHGEAFDHSEQLKKHTVNNETELLHRVTSGRPFIGVGNKPALMLYAQKEKLQDQIEFLNPPIDRGENYMAFSKKRPDAKRIANTFSAAFRNFAKTKLYRDILVKYGFSSN